MKDLIKAKYDKNGSWGLSESIDLHSCNPKLVRSVEKIKEFVIQLCELIEVKRFGECIVVHFGQRDEIAGRSMTQLIETSLISGHFANKTNNIYLDIFSCKYYNPELAAEFAKKYFRAKSADINYTFRK